MNGLFEWDMTKYLKEILEAVGIKLKTITPIYVNESGLGGYGIIFGNTFGMILAHILLIVIGILALIGLVVVIGWLFTRKKGKMDPHEKWLKTGKM